MKSLQGHLLVASPRLLDPNFARAVVLMVQHGEEGALGLILNRPLETTVKEVCDSILETGCAVDAVLHQGGPCEGPLMVVHGHDAGGEVEVVPGLYFTADRARIEGLLQAEGAQAKYFVGYAGWGAGQLESELETGSWLTTAVEPPQVFADGDKLWPKLTTALTAGIHPDRIPDDPTLN